MPTMLTMTVAHPEVLEGLREVGVPDGVRLALWDIAERPELDGDLDIVVDAALGGQRGIDDAVRDMADGLWRPVLRSSLADRRVMVLGYGSIGAAVPASCTPRPLQTVTCSGMWARACS